MVIVRRARIVTPVSWIAGPKWLTSEQALQLGGHEVEVLEVFIWDIGVEAEQEGHTGPSIETAFSISKSVHGLFSIGMIKVQVV